MSSSQLAESSYATSTYESTKAQEWNSSQADQIHWERTKAYRNQNYRHLHHQNGVIGTFQIRLLEAADLRRSYWSALAVGPVKLLGLSKAHGSVSSFVSFSLDRRSLPSTTQAEQPTRMDAKPAAKAPPQPPCFVSPVIPHNDNPVWTSCHFDFPFRKGALRDGQPIRMQLRVDEVSTAIENLIPGVSSGGDSRLLGMGSLDITSLCLGQVVNTGQPQVGVLDTWVPIYLNGNGNGNGQSQEAENNIKNLDPFNPLKKPSAEESSTSNTNAMGRVRVLISYQPNGMEPQAHDMVAMEAFARQDGPAASCRPILPPRLPLRVLETSGPWLLVEYQLPQYDSKACLKLHRNAVFVLERKNILDDTLNLALMPADLFMSTPWGRSTQDLIGPLFVASKQLLMPAMLSSKLVWMAVRTTALASFSGVQAATSAMWNEGSSSLTQEDDPNRRRNSDGNNYKFVTL
jgi:hypothetical protein